MQKRRAASIVGVLGGFWYGFLGDRIAQNLSQLHDNICNRFYPNCNAHAYSSAIFDIYFLLKVSIQVIVIVNSVTSVSATHSLSSFSTISLAFLDRFS